MRERLVGATIKTDLTARDKVRAIEQPAQGYSKAARSSSSHYAANTASSVARSGVAQSQSGQVGSCDVPAARHHNPSGSMGSGETMQPPTRVPAAVPVTLGASLDDIEDVMNSLGAIGPSFRDGHDVAQSAQRQQSEASALRDVELSVSSSSSGGSRSSGESGHRTSPSSNVEQRLQALVSAALQSPSRQKKI